MIEDVNYFYRLNFKESSSRYIFIFSFAYFGYLAVHAICFHDTQEGVDPLAYLVAVAVFVAVAYSVNNSNRDEIEFAANNVGVLHNIPSNFAPIAQIQLGSM